MSSIYQRVLGDDFSRLHPQIQRRFGFSSADGIASIGRGVMDEIWKGRFYTEPFLHFGSYYQLQKGGVVQFTYAGYTHWPVDFKPGRYPPPGIPAPSRALTSASRGMST